MRLSPDLSTIVGWLVAPCRVSPLIFQKGPSEDQTLLPLDQGLGNSPNFEVQVDLSPPWQAVGLSLGIGLQSVLRGRMPTSQGRKHS